MSWTTDYGNIDIPGLDGGWITYVMKSSRYHFVDARKRNPGMISVDRTIRGRMRTTRPASGIPAKQLDILGKPYHPEPAPGMTPNAIPGHLNKVIGILSEVRHELRTPGEQPHDTDPGGPVAPSTQRADYRSVLNPTPKS